VFAVLVELSLAPGGVYVLVVARQLCMELRGAEGRARLVTEARRGEAPSASAGAPARRRG
jgi:GTP cyclohydrolase I